MCGICGILGYSREFAADEALVRRMADRLAHRGPVDSGTWSAPDVPIVLGSRRLAIIDLSPHGHQPMCNENGTLWITFNGEIYNHDALRSELMSRGHRYRSRTDTETILHLYEDEGSRGVERLEGMVAFALSDARRRRLLLVRDRLGVKPLYFCRTNDGAVFGSEVKSPSPLSAVLAKGSEEAARRLGRGRAVGAFISESSRRRLPFWGGHVAFREFHKARLLRGTASLDLDSHDVVAGLWDEAAHLQPAIDPLQRITYLELRHRLSELLLMRVDRMTMAASVEAREPFLDHHLVEFAMALPPAMKIGSSGGKHILKRAVADLLPPGIATGPKQGFSAPVSTWFRRPPGELVRERMAASSLRERELLNWREVDRLWDAHRRGRADWGVQLWTLFNACIWHDAWIAGRRW